MRFLILGAGALGGLFGCGLLKGGADVTFLVRPGRAAQLKRDGLMVNGKDGDVFRAPVKTAQQGQIDGAYDVVLLCCKAYDLDSAISAVAPAVGQTSVVLPVLNGIRHIDVLKERIGAHRVLGGLTQINAALLADGTIQQTPGVRAPITEIGEFDGRKSSRCDAIKDALDAGSIPVDVVDNIMSRMWRKFFGYACIATIMSLTRSRAGAIAQSSMGPSFVSGVIDECTKIATAEGYPPPQDMINLVHGAFSQVDSSSRVSMLIDMDDGRMTEGEHTIGDLVQRAARHSLSAPILGAALCNLQAYEINRAHRQTSAS